MKKHRITCIIIILLASIWSIKVNAINYYVSNNGDNTKYGTSPNTAWKTISHVNSQTFNPGDSILFKCGDRWEEFLEISSSGNEGNHIVYSSYDTGVKPKLYGSKAITSFIPHPTLSNVYRCDGYLPVNPNDYDDRQYLGSIFYIINDTVEWGDGITLYEDSLQGLNENYEWFWQNDSVYFYYDGNINNIDTVECTQLARGININSNYITIDGFDMRYFGGRCIGTGIYPEVEMHGAIVRNCHLAYTSSKENLGYGTALFHSEMIIENNIVHSQGRRGISINIQDGAGSCVMKNVYIQDNEIYDGYHTTGIDFGIQGNNHTVRNIHIRRNKIWECYGLNKGEYASNFVFLCNHGDLEDADSIYVYNNVFMNVNSSGVWCSGIANLFIINNTFTGPAASPHAGAFIYSSLSNNGNHTIMNNIFLNYSNEGVTVVDGSSDGSTTIDTCDYNLYYAENPTNTFILFQIDSTNYRHSEWSQLQSAGYELHSPTPQYPNFIDSLNNLHLKSTSPAIGKAKPISFVTTDIEGNPRDPLTPDIGAYEYQDPSNIDNNKSLNIRNYILNQNYPNPFNPMTKISYSISHSAFITLTVYNILGQKIRTLVNKYQRNGDYSVSFGAKNLSSGIYFYKLQVGETITKTKKMILMR